MLTGQSSSYAAKRFSGFTLVELMIIVAILGILAALVVPTMRNASDDARIEALATNTKHVQGMIIHKATGTSGVPLSPGGFPTAVDPAWFRAGQLPTHAWSDRPMQIQVVNGSSADVYPAVKTFDPTLAGAVSCWYNATNGAFCALVPAQSNDAMTLAMFNDVNKSSAAALAQTTP